MRKILISALALSTLAVAAPAAAQSRGGYDPRPGHGYNQGGTRALENQLQQLRQRIDRMYQRRLISGREAGNLNERVREIRNRLYDYARNGLSYRERADIERRIHNLRERLRDERQEGREDRWDDRRDDRRGRW